jgi:nucleoside-diphosphate-sugar epimerase
MMRSALVVGASGIVGNNLATHLVKKGWDVHGLARRPLTDIEGVTPVAADLLDTASLRSALQGQRPENIFITAWLRQTVEAENIRINRAMVRNLLDVLSLSGSVKHVALVTGLKHYLGPFEAYGNGLLPPTPFREDQPRLDIDNFYYAQEDEMFSAATRDGFGWTIHRPHTIVGYALGNAMNMGVTLAIYATICRESGRPFLFPGSVTQWSGLTDMTDARLLARHLEWGATTEVAHNQAFNVVNGDVFRWSWMWTRVAGWFGLQAAPYPGEPTPLESQLADAGPLWTRIARKHNLSETDFTALTSAWHTDADLGRPIEVVANMNKSRKLGFLNYQASDESFFDLFARLRGANIIP